MKRALAAFLCALCAGCATTPHLRPRELIAMPVPLPACVFLCALRVVVTDDSTGHPQPAPEGTPAPPRATPPPGNQPE